MRIDWSLFWYNIITFSAVILEIIALIAIVAALINGWYVLAGVTVVVSVILMSFAVAVD